MAVSYRASAHATYGGSAATNVTINKPTGTAEDDVLICVLHIETGTLVTPACTGWVLAESVDAGSQLSVYLLWKIAGASEGASYQFTWSGSAWRVGDIHAFQGQTGNTGTDNPFGDDANLGSTTASTSTIASISYTADGNGLGFWVTSSYQDGGATALPGGYDSRNTHSDGSMKLGTRTDTGAGGKTSGTGTGINSVENVAIAGTILDSTASGTDHTQSPSDSLALGDSRAYDQGKGATDTEALTDTALVRQPNTVQYSCDVEVG